MKYYLNWTTKDGTRITNQMYTAEYVTEALESLEHQGATDIELRTVDTATLVSEDTIIKFVENQLAAYHKLSEGMPDNILEMFVQDLIAYQRMARALTGKEVPLE